jgi:hypothetical protein
LFTNFVVYEEFEKKAHIEEYGNDDYSLFVPGKVISMWECHPDDKICALDCRMKHGGMKSLRKIDVTTTMSSDHGTEAYKKNLLALIEQAKSGTKS